MRKPRCGLHASTTTVCASCRAAAAGLCNVCRIERTCWMRRATATRGSSQTAAASSDGLCQSRVQSAGQRDSATSRILRAPVACYRSCAVTFVIDITIMGDTSFIFDRNYQTRWMAYRASARNANDYVQCLFSHYAVQRSPDARRINVMRRMSQTRSVYSGSQNRYHVMHTLQRQTLAFNNTVIASISD